MRTEGLDFVPAAIAVTNGKCRSMESHTAAATINAVYLGHTVFADIPDEYLTATDWQLIDPVPEKRTVKGWVNLYASSHELYPFQCASAHESKEKAMDRRYPGIKYLGDPVYIEHEYEVKP